MDMDLERLPSEHFSTNSDIMVLALMAYNLYAALRTGESPGGERQSGEQGAPAEEGAAATPVHGNAGSDVHSFPDFVSCKTTASVFRSLQSEGRCVAKSSSEVHDPRYVGGYCREMCHMGIFATSDSFNASGYKPSVVTSSDRCVGCLKCLYVCPDFAITIKEGRPEQCPA